MYELCQKPQDLKQLFLISLRQYWNVFRSLFLWFFVFAVVKDANLYIGYFIHQPLAISVFGYLQPLMMIYLFCCMLRMTHFCLQSASNDTMMNVLRYTFPRFLKVVLFLVMLLAGMIFLFYMGGFVHELISHFKNPQAKMLRGNFGMMVYYTFLAFLFSYLLVRLIFVMPLLIVSDDSFIDNVVSSSELTARYWMRVAVFYGGAVFFALFCSQNLYWALLAYYYHLNILLDFVLMSILLPFLSMMLLLLLSDLQLRANLSEVAVKDEQ